MVSDEQGSSYWRRRIQIPLQNSASLAVRLQALHHAFKLVLVLVQRCNAAYSTLGLCDLTSLSGMPRF
jgi:hypothetical protein